MLHSIVVDAFSGPTIHDLSPVIDGIPDPVDVGWVGSRQDYHYFETFPERSFILHVTDQDLAEKTLWNLGAALPISQADLSVAKKALVSEADQTWRSTVDGIGATRGTQLLLKIASESLRKGLRPTRTLAIAIGCLCDGLHPADADVMLRVARPRRN